MRIIVVKLALSLIAFTLSLNLSLGKESECYGSVNKGKLIDGVQLPLEGSNFSAYSSIGHAVGRTYLHSRVHALVLAAYDTLASQDKSLHFVYGETGWASGGRIRPHRTHQNGLSIDFMVPVRDRSGKSVPLPTNALNKFGYDIDFDQKGQFREYRIDFEAMAQHILQVKNEAKKRNIVISLAIFDPDLLPLLFSTKAGAEIKDLPWMKQQAWVRHDEHYHIDFSIPCKPLENG